jgi:hypothetical protein
LIVGILILILTIGAVVLSLIRTPDNLEGWYGVMYVCIGLGGIIGGISLIISAF